MASRDTREHLIQIGLTQLHEAGYGATGVNQILESAQVPKGSFYHHFLSKEAFAAEVLQRYSARETAHCEAILGDHATPPLKRLRTYFRHLIELYGRTGPISGCMLGGLSLEVADHNPHLQALLSESFAQWQNGIAATIQDAIDAGELPSATDSDMLAAFLVNSWEGAQVRSKADRSDRPLEMFYQFAFDVLLK